MIAFAVTALFAVSTVTALSVIGVSLRRASIIYRELQNALADCEMHQPIVIRMKSMEPPARAPRLRPAPASASGQRRLTRPVAQPAWRAAA